jgi:hypothetical protein
MSAWKCRSYQPFLILAEQVAVVFQEVLSASLDLFMIIIQWKISDLLHSVGDEAFTISQDFF